MSDSAPLVRLTVLKGPAEGTEYRFDTRATCVIGRAGDCLPRMPRTDAHVSRYHCLLDISPPALRLRSLGTTEATWVNGAEIGGWGAGAGAAVRDLVDGDEVRVGETVLRISVDSGGAPPCTAASGSVSPEAHYEQVRELSRSPRRVVTLARRRAGGERVALVTLRAAGPGGAVGGGAAFLEAAGRLGDLRHERIARLYDSGAWGRSAYWLAFEHLPGGTLRDLLAARGGTLPPTEAVGIAVQLLEGLAHAHGAGAGTTRARPLVHGSVTPSNVLLADVSAKAPGGAPEVKLGGFGIATAFDGAGLAGLTRAEASAVTAARLPRPQLTDYRTPGPEMDVWAAAATLYRMLTGAAPRAFPPGRDPLQVLLRDTALPVRHRMPSVPRRLAQVVDAALIDGPGIVTRQADALGRALLEAVG